MLPPLERSPTLMPLVREGHYVSISGQRQCGKTSLLQACVEAINADGWGRAVMVSCEPVGNDQEVHDVPTAVSRLLDNWHAKLRRTFPEVGWPAPDLLGGVTDNGFGHALAEWSMASDRPLILVIDEVDTLARLPFVALLRQIRAGFPDRGVQFPHAIVLAGMRHLRDHDIALGGDGSGSPFNVVEFVTVGNFSDEEVRRLYAQHEASTGQAFSATALDRVCRQTRGQPWLVNAIARTCVTELVPDPVQAVEPAHVDEAIRRLESAGTTHLMSLTKRLSEDRVMRVIAPIVVGDVPVASADDERYALELGLLQRGEFDRLEPANPIYARALLQAFSAPSRRQLAHWSPSWLVDGHIDLDRLRENFLAFWSLHRDMMKDRITYPEAVSHFGLMTYLDRVANGGGRVDREYAVGRGRLDLLLHHGDVRLPIEVKVHRDRSGDPVPAGLSQLDRYCERLGVSHAWLVVFDQRSSATGTRLENESVAMPGGRSVLVIRA